MLVLTRKRGERIIIGPDIELTIVDVRGDRVRLGFEAPPDVSIHRQEVLERIQQDGPKTANADACTSTSCR